MRAFYAEPDRGELIKRNKLDPLPFKKNSVSATQIANGPLPILKHNLGMRPADKRILNREIAIFQPPNAKRSVKAVITPVPGAHFCRDLYGRHSALLCLNHGDKGTTRPSVWSY